MKKLEPPTIEETREQLDSLQLDAAQQDWDQGSNLSAQPAGDDKQLLSPGADASSRRASLLFEEDGEAGSELGSEEDEGEREEGGEERKRKRQDEVFVDKTRAAMVVIGTKDIKEALERKKKDEILRKNPEARVAHVLFHQARFLLQQGRYSEALLFANRALAVEPERKDWLTEKSRCYLNLLQPEAALQVVDEVLKKDPTYFKAVALKGEILYSLWDLEKAMLCFVEGRRLRPDNTQCIRGVHKVKMALEEIAAFQAPLSSRKKKRRSKSAKGRLTAVVSADDFQVSRNPDVSSRRPSSRLTPLSESRTTPPSTPDSNLSDLPSPRVTRRRFESPSTSPSPKSEVRVPLERPMSAKGKRGSSAFARPKTAAVSGKRAGRVRPKTAAEPQIDDIRRFIRESMSRSTSIRCFSASTQQSSHSGANSPSFSSSMEDVSRDSESKQPQRAILPKVKTKTEDRSDGRKRPMITSVSASLGQDRIFLEGLLKDKDLKRSKTAYTRRALKIAREVQGFVSERERYWRNRESFVRYATTADEDTLI